VTAKPALCCDNDAPALAYDAPSDDAKQIGKVTTSHSWFVCWMHGSPQRSGHRVWYFTSLDYPPGDSWGWVGSDWLEPGQTGFDPEEPPATLPNCFCPAAP